MEKPIDRVRELIQAKQLSVSAFEKAIGMSNNSIQQALKRNANLKDETLNNILKAFPDVSPGWILTGNGGMFHDSTKDGLENILGYADILTKEKMKVLDLLDKRDIVKYLQLKQTEFDKVEEFQLYKRLLIKDDVIAELIKRLQQK